MPSIPPLLSRDLPEQVKRWVEELRNILRPMPKFLEDAGSPEGVVTAPRGTRYFRTDGSAGTWLYVKTTTTGNTGWVAYA